MSDLGELLTGLVARPLIAVLPPGDNETMRRLAGVLLDVGCAAIAVPWPQPRAHEALAAVAAIAQGRAVVAMTAVPGPTEARQAIRHGAQLVIGTGVRPAMVEVCHRAGALCALGALTPTEALSATEAAADYVRVGPIEHLGGPAYLAALRAQLPWIVWMVAGEIGAEALLAYRVNGAALFELGSALLPPPLVEPGREAVLAAHVARFVAAAAALPPVALDLPSDRFLRAR